MKNNYKTKIVAFMVFLGGFQLIANAQYTLTLDDVDFDETTGTIQKYLNTTEKNIEIPGTFNVDGQNISVSAIGESAFFNKELTNVVLPESITTLEQSAFSFNKLDSIDLSYVTSIGSYAFRSNNLSKIIFPTNDATIGELAFATNQLESIEIPNSITRIGRYAFKSNLITDVVIPDNVISIGGGAFNNNAITNVNGKASTGIIYARTALGIDDSTTIISYGGVADIIDFIPSQVTKIDDSGFLGNQLTDVTIPDNVDSIDIFAFEDNNITTLNLGNSISYLGTASFKTNELTSITLPESLTYIGGSSFMDNKLTSIIIPEGVKTVATNAFMANSLTEVTVPNSVSEIGNAAFNDNAITIVNGQSSNGIIYARNEDGTNDSTEIVSFGGTANVIDFIPNKVKVLSNQAFFGNYSDQITSVVLPDSILSIGYQAFYTNTQLESITLPVAKKSNQTFKNWEDMDGDSIAGGSVINDFSNTYTAVFKSYTITFNVYCDSTLADDDIFVTIEDNGSVQLDTNNVAKFDELENGTYQYALVQRVKRESTELVSGEVSVDNADVIENILLYSETTGIKEKVTSDINIFPNPVKDILYLQTKEPVNCISIMDITGHELYRNNNSNISEVNVSSFKPGVYIINIDGQIRKIIKH